MGAPFRGSVEGRVINAIAVSRQRRQERRWRVRRPWAGRLLLAPFFLLSSASDASALDPPNGNVVIGRPIELVQRETANRRVVFETTNQTAWLERHEPMWSGERWYLAWRPLCTSPCSIDVPATGLYRVSGPGLQSSAGFRLPEAQSAVHVQADPGSSSAWGWGLAGILVGGVFVGTSALLFSARPSMRNRHEHDPQLRREPQGCRDIFAHLGRRNGRRGSLSLAGEQDRRVVASAACGWGSETRVVFGADFHAGRGGLLIRLRVAACALVLPLVIASSAKTQSPAERAALSPAELAGPPPSPFAVATRPIVFLPDARWLSSSSRESVSSTAFGKKGGFRCASVHARGLCRWPKSIGWPGRTFALRGFFRSGRATNLFDSKPRVGRCRDSPWARGRPSPVGSPCRQGCCGGVRRLLRDEQSAGRV